MPVRPPPTIDNTGTTRISIAAPRGFRLAAVNVLTGAVEYEAMAVAAGIAKKPKRKAGR